MNAICKYPGGKCYLAKWIVSHFPKHYEELDFVEGCAGMANVTRAKKRSKTEVLMEANIDIACLLETLSDNPVKLQQALKKVSYSENTFAVALEKLADTASGDIFSAAVNVFIVHNMSRGGAGKSFAWSERTRGGLPGDLNAWNQKVECLPEQAARFRNVTVSCDSVFDTEVTDLDSPNTLFYIDPPYLHETRNTTKEYGRFEWTADQHIAFAAIANSLEGYIAISGYGSTLYEQLYAGWRVEKKEIPNHASQKKTKPTKVECLWLNYDEKGRKFFA